MDAREFDALIERIATASSRRHAVKGVLGGALAGAGVVAAAEAKNKGKKGRKGKGGRVGSETNARNGKRTLCLCKEEPTTTGTTETSPPPGRLPGRVQSRALVCETKTLKTKKAKKALRNNPGSYRGPCEDATTTTSTTATSTTSTSTSTTSTSTTAAPPS